MTRNPFTLSPPQPAYPANGYLISQTRKGKAVFHMLAQILETTFDPCTVSMLEPGKLTLEMNGSYVM